MNQITGLLTNVRKHRPDYLLMLATGLLLLAGLIIIYSISPVLSHKILGNVSDNYYLYQQAAHIGVGLVVFFIAANIPYPKWQDWLPWLIVITGLSLLLLMIPGLASTRNGATRWINLGPLSFQPAELIKFTLVIALATQFQSLVSHDHTESRRRLWLALFILAVLSLFIMILQRDMGTMIVITDIIIGLLFVSGERLVHVGALIGIGLIMGVLSIIIFPHRLQRLVTFVNPAQNQSTSGYHLSQALIAIGSGGFTGLGIGKSVQVYGYLPEAANDSIFAIIAETVGFIGVVAVIALFGFLLYRGFMVATNAPNRFAQLLAMGVVIWIGAQAVINMTAMVGLIPLTGVPLPFLSYGGTNLVMMLAAMGILVNISKYSQRGKYAHSTLGRRNRRPHYAYSDNRLGA